MKHYILYSTEGCHLCEQAYQLCLQLGLSAQVEIIDIVTNEQLAEQYGVHIPVLKRLATEQQLFWPFDINALTEFVA